MAMIEIIVSHGEPYVWKPSDWYRLRTEFRIMGFFDGAVSENESTNIHLPFKLTKVETQFLIKHGIAVTVEAPSRLTTLKAPVTKETYEALRTERIVKQLEEYKSRKRASLETLVDTIFEGKQKAVRGIIPNREAIIQDELGNVKKPPIEYIYVDYKDPWVDYDEYIPFDFPTPSTHMEELKLRVYEDFHINRNYFITSGIKFGGHFLAYPGEPTKYHAEFIIVCEDPSRKLHNLLLRGEARLAHGVKKTLLIASLDSQHHKLTYRKGPSCY